MQEKVKKTKSDFRIVILTLESFVSLKGLRILLENLHQNIVLVFSSRRFGGKYGSFLKQLKRSIQKCGLRFVVYQAFNLILPRILIPAGNILGGAQRKKKVGYDLCSLTKKYFLPMIRSSDLRSKEIVQHIKSLAPDLIISFYCDHIIKKEIIDIPTYGVINVHASLLPYSKGPFPVLWTALKGRNGGVSVHFVVDESLDTGPIILQKEIPLNPQKSLLRNEREIMAIGAEIISELIPSLLRRDISPSPQREPGDYLSFPRKSDMDEVILRGFHLFGAADIVEMINQ